MWSGIEGIVNLYFEIGIGNGKLVWNYFLGWCVDIDDNLVYVWGGGIKLYIKVG